MHSNECCQDTKKALDRLWHAEHPDKAVQIRNKDTPTWLTAPEKRAEQLFIDTRQRLTDGRYQVGLLWKNTAYLQNNYRQALQAFYNLERQMEHQPEMKKQFTKNCN